MAQNESNREDLWAEATGLSPCWEFAVAGWAEPVVVGFKVTGALSFYFGAELVYQFDEAGRLRRGYEEGFLYRSEGTTLSRLQRERSDEVTRLLRSDLSEVELGVFLDRCRESLVQLQRGLEGDQFQVLRVRGTDEASLRDLSERLNEMVNCPLRLSPALR